MRKIFHHKYFLPTSLLGFLIVCFFPIVVAHKKADPDAQFILPILEQVSGLSDYFQKMSTLQLIDVQPLRDLSFYVDLFFFDHFSLNTFVFQNLFWWLATCMVIMNIIRKRFPDISKGKIFLLIFAFSVYPLFSTTIIWGMARKHLMSFFFIALATERLLLNESNISLRNKIIIIFSFLFAMLSQPIGILWTLWALVFVFFEQKNNKKDFLTIFPFLFLISLITGIWNNHYYRLSKVYLHHFAPKPDTLFKPADQILALGHYVFDLIIPFFPSFQFTLGHWSTLLGILIILLVLLTLYKFKRLKESSVWILFFIFPLIPILTQPEMMQDTYLLIPSLGALLLILQNINVVSKKFLYVLICVGSIFSFHESIIWLSKRNMITQSFSNAPSCLTALSTVRLHHNEFEKAPQSALDYVRQYNCIGDNNFSGISMQQALYLQSTIMYYDETIPIADRRGILNKLSRIDIMGLTYLTAFLIKEKRFEEANIELKKVTEIYRKQIYVVYDVINAKVILPYCLKINNEDCIEVFRRHSVPPITPFD